jgi:peptidoglycan/LPS O-acetylase OafA/YrhL
LFLVQNLTGSGSLIGPLWSLPYEVQSYLALPFLYMAALRVRSYMGALLLCAMGVGVLVLEGLFAQIVGYPLLLIYAPWFFMGAAAFSISRLVGATIGARWYVVSLGVFVLSPLLATRLIHNYSVTWVLWATGSTFAIALPHFRNCTAALPTRACRLIARYSYGIYLTHVPILWFVFRKLSGEPQWLQLALLIALLSLVPVALYHALEAPMIRAGAAIAASLARRSNVPVAILAS